MAALKRAGGPGQDERGFIGQQAGRTAQNAEAAPGRGIIGHAVGLMVLAMVLVVMPMPMGRVALVMIHAMVLGGHVVLRLGRASGCRVRRGMEHDER